MRATISDKGQVTIPKPLREQLGFSPGDPIDLHINDGVLTIRKADTSSREIVQSLYGIIKSNKTTDQLIEELRGKADAV